jgi:predicted amidohydrolase YtcJ
MSERSDLLVAGTIHTLDPARPRAEAVLVRDGRFVKVGSLAACEAEARPGTRRVELGKGAALPGLADAHGHVAGYGLSLVQLDLRDATSAADAAARAAERATRTPAGRWIRGRGWDDNRFRDPKAPDLETLSRAVPEHPAFLVRVDGHAAWANRKALELAGIGPGTADPSGGRIVRDAQGRPTGILVDHAMDLVLARIPEPSEAEYEEAILSACGAFASVGLASVGDAGVPMAALPVFRRLGAEGKLPIRVYGMLDGMAPAEQLRDAMNAWRSAREAGWFRVRAVKLYADGALGSRGAAMLEPYADDAGNLGLLLLEPAVLRERVAAVVAAGLQPCVHAIGDRACREVLRTFVALEPGARALRPRVEHLQILQPEDAPLLARAGAIASMQPTHATSDGPWVPARLGAGTARLAGAYAWRTVLQAGAALAFGSDFPIEDPDPRPGIAAAETRRTRTGEVFLPEQRMTRLEAVRAFTSGVAYAEHAEARRGMIREGFEADLTAFAEDLLALPADAIPGLPVTLTLVGGRVAFEG